MDYVLALIRAVRKIVGDRRDVVQPIEAEQPQTSAWQPPIQVLDPDDPSFGQV